MYNLLVRRVVFPVSVVSRCPRQIAEWKGCASPCCALLPSSCRQEAGVQLQSILLNVKTSPRLPAGRAGRLGRLAAGRPVFVSLRHLPACLQCFLTAKPHGALLWSGGGVNACVSLHVGPEGTGNRPRLTLLESAAKVDRWTHL